MVEEIPDDGFVEFKIGDAKRSIDVYETWNRILDIQEECANAATPTAFLARVLELMQQLGFGNVSQYAADAFVHALNKRVTALGNALAGEPMPDSPARTERPS